MQIKNIMHRGVVSVSPEAPVTAVAKRMKEEDVGAVPVMDGDRLIGMITDRDLALRALADGEDLSRLTARDLMTPQVVFCRDDEEADDAIRLMEDRQIRRLPVMDGAGRVVGMVGLGDIAHALSRDMSAEVLRSVSDHHP